MEPYNTKEDKSPSRVLSSHSIMDSIGALTFFDGFLHADRGELEVSLPSKRTNPYALDAPKATWRRIKMTLQTCVPLTSSK